MREKKIHWEREREREIERERKKEKEFSESEREKIIRKVLHKLDPKSCHSQLGTFASHHT